MNENEVKLNNKLEQLELCINNFEASLSITTEMFPDIVTDTIKSGQIQKFKSGCELFWKTLRTYLHEKEGIDENSPKSVLKAYFNAGRCDYDDYEKAIEMMNDRNLLSHLYKSALAKSIDKKLFDYLILLKK